MTSDLAVPPAGPPGGAAGAKEAPGPPEPSRPRGPLVAWLGAVVALAVFVLGVGGWMLALAVERPYKGWSGDEVFVEIPQGAGVAAITARLAEAGVIERPVVFRLAVWQRGADRQLKAGEYRFARPITPRQVVDRLTKGDVYLKGVTFPEGLTIEEMAAIYEAEGFGPAQAFVTAASDGSLVADLDPLAQTLEGYVFPDTYQLPRRASADALVRQMVKRFRSVVGEEAAARAQARGYTVRQVVTLASLVEKETARDDERPIVAGVYANRVERRMPLQCDPTVIYALKQAGRWTGNITRADLQFDSPYNTYRYPGIPPGPVASPGRASLEAAFAPPEVPYLYFVSRNDGSHAFARTLAEHNANVRRFQVEYFRERRARERQGH